ncbi:MAG: ethanolamine utilization protein EutJ [Anaerolineae bacterium]|nr:ethanolamine utilization protein EutJ [Anaerolineae bacterium]
MNPQLDQLLARLDAVMAPNAPANGRGDGGVHVGVDLGTAYTVLIALDSTQTPIGAAYRFAQVVRDGLVVDFGGAVELVKTLKAQVEQQLGHELTRAATAYPPGVPLAEVRATGYVLEAAGLECVGYVDEPSAANNVLQVKEGAIADVGGGTTGIAVIHNGRVVYTADEPTGGTHFSLVIAGAKNIPFEEAERLKTDPARQKELFPLVRPVMEKVAEIIRRHVQGKEVQRIYLVGGACAYPGMAQVVEEYTGIAACVPGKPLFITPLGIAMHAAQEAQ